MNRAFGPAGGGFGKGGGGFTKGAMPTMPRATTVPPPTAAESPEPNLRSSMGMGVYNTQKKDAVDFGDLRSKDVVVYTPQEFLNGKPEESEECAMVVDLSMFPELVLTEGARSIADLMEEECKKMKTARAADDNAGDRSMFGTSAQADNEANVPVTPLVTTENGFRVRAQDELSEIELLAKTVTGVLNKLTPEKYDTLSNQLIENDAITTDEPSITKTIELIFDRAVNQPSFSEMYAELSHMISVREKMRVDAKEKEKTVFRRLLVEAVQKEFEARKASSEGSETAKKRKLGNIQFVGELFKKEMLTERVIHHIIGVILNGDRNAPADFHPDPEDVEVLCRLLSTTGRMLESKARRPESPFLDPWNKYFARIEKLALATQYPPRIKITLLNTIDLRKEGWPDKTQKAKKLKDLEKENEEKERKKLEGMRHANHTGDKTAWGQAANIHEALTTKNDKPKSKEKKKKDDDWDVVKPGKGKGKNQEKKKGTQQQQQPSKGTFSALDSKTASKEEKKKDKKKKEDKKEKKEKKDKKDDDEEKKERPPPSVAEEFKIKVVNRAREAMQESEEKRWELVEEDFESFKADVESPSEMVVHEVLRGIASNKDEEDRSMLTEYLGLVCAMEDETDKPFMVRKSEMIRGVAWFLSSAAVLRYIDDYPAIYKRIVAALQTLIPAADNIYDINKAVQMALKSARLWFEDMQEDERTVDDAEELYAELISDVWMPLHEGLSLETDDEQTKALTCFVTMNHKLGWPNMTTGEYNDDCTPKMCSVFERMLGTLIKAEVFSTELLEQYIEQNQGSSKSKNSTSAKYLQTLLKAE